MVPSIRLLPGFKACTSPRRIRFTTHAHRGSSKRNVQSGEIPRPQRPGFLGRHRSIEREVEAVRAWTAEWFHSLKM